MTDLILHHYNASPFSEKIRLMLGYKALAWRSVIAPTIMPKPQLVALTGGYRGVPVLQIGADVYCDSALIARELDRRHPQPPLFPATTSPWAHFVAGWADQVLFWKAARLLMGESADRLPQAFVDDRVAMGRTELRDPAAAQRELPNLRAQLSAILSDLDAALGATACVGGDQLGYADFALYHNLWFAARNDAGLIGATRVPRVAAWMARVKACGQGKREEIDAEAAIAVARAAEPIAVAASTPDAGGPQPGETVSIRPESFGVEQTLGRLVAIDAQRVTIARQTPELGTVHVHFPRLGYVLQRA